MQLWKSIIDPLHRKRTKYNWDATHQRTESEKGCTSRAFFLFCILALSQLPLVEVGNAVRVYNFSIAPYPLKF